MESYRTNSYQRSSELMNEIKSLSEFFDKKYKEANKDYINSKN